MVTVQINTRISPLIDEAFIYHVASTTLDILGFEFSEVSVVLDNDDQIRKLNNTYRNLDEPTDVLSFSSGEIDPDTGSRYLGDVVISFTRAKAQAVEQGHSIKKELTTLIVHGILHLAGYDHANNEEEKELFGLQSEILDELSTDWMVTKSDRIFDSFRNATEGFLSALKTERNLWIHIALSVLAVGLGLFLRITLTELAILVLVISAVFMSEFFNTALEYLVNFASPEKNELARKAKDISAAAVLIVATASLIIGGIIFLPRLFALIF
ncbi:MAG: rRNA maturation RNase YbeY [Pelolinea sp.]|nr:rRNA maturation RNase YbeY [Pelolinea sp.]